MSAAHLRGETLGVIIITAAVALLPAVLLRRLPAARLLAGE